MNIVPPSGRIAGWEPGDLSRGANSAAKEIGYPSNRLERTLQKMQSLVVEMP